MPFRMSTDNRLGVPDFQLYAVDTTPRVPTGTIIRAFDDTTVLGDAEFIYLQASSAINVMSAVVFRNGPGAAIAGTSIGNHANSGRSIAVSLTNVPAGSYGWFCISGVIPVAVSAATVDGRVHITAGVGVLATTQANGAQVLGAVFASAAGIPGAGQAYVQLNRSSIQTQIV